MSDTASTSAPRPVLLVEDDLDQAHLLRFLLEDSGLYEVTLAQDGLTGSDLARKREWAVVITDLNLPGALGRQVVEASREASPHTPILATTGYAGPEYAEDALARGADHVLLKPLDRDELLHHVDRLASGGKGCGTPPQQEADEVEETAAALPPEGEVELEAPPSLNGVPASRRPLRVLGLGLRPGELIEGAGGTLHRHHIRGDQVIMLVVGPGSEGSDRARARVEQSAQLLGIRGFLGPAPESDSHTFLVAVTPLLRNVFEQLRPDVLYVPTGNRSDPLARLFLETCLRFGSDIRRIFCYDKGDADHHFRPSLFMPVAEALSRKLLALDEDLPVAARRGESPLTPPQSRSDRVEAFEAVFGGEPWEGAAASSPARVPVG